MARRTANKHIKRHCKLLNYSDSLSDITSPCSLILQSRKCLQIGGNIFPAWCSSIQQYSNQQYSIVQQLSQNGEKSKCWKNPIILPSLIDMEHEGDLKQEQLVQCDTHPPLSPFPFCNTHRRKCYLRSYSHSQTVVVLPGWLLNVNGVTEEEMFEIFICTTTGAISWGPRITDPESPTENRVLTSFLQMDVNVAKENTTCYRVPCNCHVIEMPA